MPEHRLENEPSIFTVQNALLAAFKHKWLIIICTVIGFIAAASVWFFFPVPYASQAKLLVRYVVDRSVEPIENANIGAGRTSETIVASEVEILRSWDLAMQVAEAIGVKRLLPDSNGKGSLEEAAGTVSSGLEVVAARGSNIILVTYSNRHP